VSLGSDLLLEGMFWSRGSLKCGMKLLIIRCSSPTIVRVIKSRRMRWAGHVDRMGKGEAGTEFWWGNLRERDH
jgi:hypothetical protein